MGEIISSEGCVPGCARASADSLLMGVFKMAEMWMGSNCSGASFLCSSMTSHENFLIP